MRDLRLHFYAPRQLAFLRERFADEGLDSASARDSGIGIYGVTILDRAAARGERKEVEAILESIHWERV